MMQYLFRITEDNKMSLNRPHESNRVYYSELNKWETKNAFRSFSLKYVLDGFIDYQVDGRLHRVGQGNFLIADKRDDVAAYFQSETTTRSICIDINTDLISEAVSTMGATDFDFENYLARYFSDSLYCARIYSIHESALGKKLFELASDLRKGENPSIDDQWFLVLAELIVLQEKSNSLALNGIQSVKPSTRIETLDRLNRGKAYMDEMFLSNPGIGEVARCAAMSEFHFFRSFRQAFGITPYRYLLHRRLEYSKTLLAQRHAVKDAAVKCGFADIFTFSKAFRKAYGIPPSKWLMAS